MQSSPRFPTPPDHRRDFGSHDVRCGQYVECRVAQHQPAIEHQSVLPTPILAEYPSCTVEFTPVHFYDRSAATVDEVADVRTDCRIHLQEQPDPVQRASQCPLRFRGESGHCQPNLASQLCVAASTWEPLEQAEERCGVESELQALVDQQLGLGSGKYCEAIEHRLCGRGARQGLELVDQYGIECATVQPKPWRRPQPR